MTRTDFMRLARLVMFGHSNSSFQNDIIAKTTQGVNKTSLLRTKVFWTHPTTLRCCPGRWSCLWAAPPLLLEFNWNWQVGNFKVLQGVLWTMYYYLLGRFTGVWGTFNAIRHTRYVQKSWLGNDILEIGLTLEFYWQVHYSLWTNLSQKPFTNNVCVVTQMSLERDF